MRNLLSHFGPVLIGLGLISFPTAGEAQFTLSTTVTYSGRQTGDVWVVASPFKTPLITTFKTRLETPNGTPFANVPATITNLVGTYYLFAWRDSITNDAPVPDATESQGWHPGNPFVVSSNRTVTGFVLEDPDHDADGLPDWWEAHYGLPTRPGSGRSGALVLQPGETAFTDSIWASVVGSNPAGAPTLNISTNRGFTPNDLVLIITMQDTNQNWALNSAGTFEFARVASASSNLLILRSNRLNAFTVGTSNKIQVLQVPEYTEVTMPPAFSMQFNGSGDYVEAGNVPLANASFTIEAWAKRDSSDTMDMIVVQGSPSAHHGLLFGFHWDWVGFVFDFYGDGPVSLNVDDAWHHWAGTYDASTRLQCLYRDGILLATNVAAQNYQGSGPLFIGRAPFDNPAWFGGAIDEVRIWNKARSQAEIQADMNRALTGTESGLLAYYPFDEGAGTNVLDATGHGYDGVTRGSPVWALPRLNSPTTLTCQPWNGTNGGVLAFLAHQVTVGNSASINADGKGYRGGEGAPSSGSSYQFGMAGERTTGFSVAGEGNSLERPQGGGGAGRGADGSGGGGAYGSPGIDGAKVLAGSDYGRGASAYGGSELFRFHPGGGGGGSGSHTTGRVGVAGGTGGGVVFVAAGFMEGSGVISSRGAAGQAGMTNGAAGAVNPDQGSGGGGGAGGSVYLVGNVTHSIQVSATGGAGGARHPLPTNSKDGGAGGLGRIRLDLPPDVSVPTNVFPSAGQTNQSLAGMGLLPRGDAYDSDLDGLSDWQEYVFNTNPLNPDSDGDTLPDWWEVAYGLNPLDPTDAAADKDGDGVINLLEFHHGTRPDLADTDGDGLTDYEELFVYRTDPLQQDTDADGISDFDEILAGTDPLFSGTQYFYDFLARLVGAQYENGLGLAYEYDDNHNLRRQVYTQRDANANHLPDLWEFLHGLTNNTGGFVDTDGDGGSDWQEWQAGTDPRDPNSKPDVLGSSGDLLASLSLPFTPANFVVGVGQLDGLSAEEIVLGADGNPGTTTNILLVLSQTASGWTTQRVDIGPFGVTSIAVGQPANRPSPAIYVGLRQAGGTGNVAEVTFAGGQWTLNTIAHSVNEAAFVLGVRPGRHVLVSLAATNSPDGASHYLSYASGWTNVLATAESSQRGLGTMTGTGLPDLPSRGLRLLDSGGLQIVGHDVNVQADAIWNADYGRWFFRTATTYTWANAQAYARNSFGGNLATVNDSTLDTWLWTQFGGSGFSFWIGLFRESLSAPWQWASGAPFVYANWAPNEPSGNGLGTHKWDAHGGKWDDTSTALRGVIEVAAMENRSIQAAEPFAARRLLWRGHNLSAGNLRSNQASILYTFADDKNQNGVMDDGDEFVLVEFVVSGSSATLHSLQRIPLSGSVFSQSYGLACVDVLYSQQQLLFTAEPDGRLYAWSATNTTPALQRQLFSAQHTSKGWHALAGVKTLEAGESLLGLRVDPAAPNQCDVILWPPQARLPALAAVPQTAPITLIQSAPALGRDIARVDIRIWDAEGNASRPELHYQLPGESAWANATLAAINGAPYGWVPTAPTGRTHQLSWDAARDLGPGFTNTVTLRARAQDITLTGAWSPIMDYVVQNSMAHNPRAYADFATTAQGVAVDIDVLANDTVEHGAPKHIASAGIPTHGSAVTNLNQTIRYTPVPDFAGTDQFTYTLTDGAGAYSMATVTVRVTPGIPAEVVLTAPAVLGGNQFSMTITGPVGVYQVQASTNLITWLDVQALTNLTGSVPFTEQVPTNAPARFYRALLLP